MPAARAAAFADALQQARRLRLAGQGRAAMAALERAHVLGQARFGWHLRVHGQMLALACAGRDGREAAGQLLRIVLTPVGHLTGRLPPGNIGSSRVSAFQPMPVPPDLQRLLDDAPPPPRA
ncbi:DUF3703 domain-containing protein [Pseudorhodoferax sp.]|uniref:DUF3703 domain-containing protein n=1 Tax=Pseudorhodoferax sp. TaxID=1993553 RepID=UPI002DD69B30|nr:DUF3703 domain-containing protein [Pseudorhodoferax sp.]